MAEQREINGQKSRSSLIISSNAAVLGDLALSCSDLAEYGDDARHNYYPPHKHHDWGENTAKSLGIVFYYWQKSGYKS